ncbi:MAG: hypothetical protein J7497_16095 [Chitinophagaceae bacterium]|nr:hypothetical protein [Chitinophagaceae bacterium]
MGSEIKNILVITTWGYKSGLVQSSTLPYLKLIHEIIPSARLYLVTQEQENNLIREEEKEVIENE